MPTRTPRPADTADDPPPELQAALDALRRIVQSVRLSSHAVERRLGLSGAQLFVLQALARGPVESLNELAARTYTHQSSVSVVVDRLVKRRLVTRERSAHDARRVRLALAADGRALLRRAPPIAQERLIDAVRSLPERDRRTLTRILDRIAHEMGAYRVRPRLLFETDGRRARR